MKRRAALEPPSPYESGIWGTTERPCPSERTLAAHLDGELDAARARLVETHLDRCAACASDVRRLENLSGCLRAWGRDTGAVAPPSRLLSRVLRTVSPEGAALRLETLRSRRAVALRVAAAVLVWAGAAVLGLRDVPQPTVGPGGVDPEGVAAGVVAAEGVAPAVALATPTVDAALAPPPARLAVSLALLERIPVLHLDVLDDEAASALAATLAGSRAAGPFAAAAVLDPAGSLPAGSLPAGSLPAGSLPAGSLPAGGAQDVRARWLAERARLAADPRTADPSAAGFTVPDLALPAGEPAAAEPASPAGGGVTLRALPRASDGAAPSELAAPYDLATAVRLDRVRVLADAAGDDGETFGLEVGVGARPVFVPAGELVAGGVADRVVRHGAWLVPSDDPYVVRLATRPLSRVRARAAAPPSPLGAVAGPALRARLARGDDAATLIALGEAQLREAGLVGPEGSVVPSLLALYTRDAAAVAARAADFVAALGPDVAGFVATDPDGRFQGLERVDLPEVARAATLARLLAGYLAEARTRSVADGARPGLRGEDVLGVLARRAPRLVVDAATVPATPGRPASVPAPSGAVRAVEPVAGLLLEATLAAPLRPTWITVLVPDDDR